MRFIVAANGRMDGSEYFTSLRGALDLVEVLLRDGTSIVAIAQMKTKSRGLRLPPKSRPKAPVLKKRGSLSRRKR